MVCVFLFALVFESNGQSFIGANSVVDLRIQNTDTLQIERDTLDLKMKNDSTITKQKHNLNEYRPKNYLDFYHYLPRETRGHVPASIACFGKSKTYMVDEDLSISNS